MKRLLACWTCALLLVTGGANAQERYPSRVVRLVVPFAVGGSTDVLARALAQQLGERIGQPVVVENRPAPGERSAPSTSQAATRRLHAAARHGQHAQRRGEPLRQARLRPGARFRADHEIATSRTSSSSTPT